MNTTTITSRASAASSRVFLTRDGRYLHLRRVAQADAAQVVDLLLRLSWQSRRLRYLSPRNFSLDTAWNEAERICRGEEGSQLALVAIAPHPAGDEVIAVAELVPDAQDPATGHLAVVVRDDYQGQGIGTALLRQILDAARSDGIDTLHADLLAENQASRRLLVRLGLSFDIRTRHGETQMIARLNSPAWEGSERSAS